MILSFLIYVDGNQEHIVNCGQIPEVYPTVDFNVWNDIDASFAVQRKFAKKGPLVNYLAWLICGTAVI